MPITLYAIGGMMIALALVGGYAKWQGGKIDELKIEVSTAKDAQARSEREVDNLENSIALERTYTEKAKERQANSQTALRHSRNKLRQLEKDNEDIKQAGDVLIPDDIYSWLRETDSLRDENESDGNP